MYKLLFNCIFLALTFSCFGQKKYELSGTISDQNKQFISGGDVMLLNAKDSSIAKYSIIAEGKFSFDPIPEGNYLLKISCLGFQEKIHPIALYEDKNLSFSLIEKPKELDEVKIVASKKTFTNNNGNLKVRIENSIFASIPNPVDLLSKLPSIQVSPDRETLNIIGKGNPLIYIDNQKVTVNDLNSLSVNDIKDIEIINNPSAKYEADGRVVILITRKLSKKEGFKIDLAETASFKTYFNNYFGVNTSHKIKKIEIKSNFQYNQLKRWESNAYAFQIDNPDIISNYKLTSTIKKAEFIFGIGAYYQINEDDYFSANINGRIQNLSFPINTNSYLKQGTIESTVLTSNSSTYPKKNYNSGFNYNNKLKKINGNLFIGSQYSTYGEEFKSRIYNIYNNTPPTELAQERYQKYSVNVFTSRIDFEKFFKNKMKWEIGSSISSAYGNAILNINSFNPLIFEFSTYNYKETNYAAYTQLTGNFKKINYSGGIRVENTIVKGGFIDSSSLLINKNYTQVFPKATISFPIDSILNLSLNYSKSISRPNYSTTTQAIAYINPFFEWANNPNLNPAITDDYSMTFQYKENSFTLGYYTSKGSVNTNFTFNPQTTILRRTDVNYEVEKGLSFNLTIPVKYKILTSTNSLTGILQKIKDPSAISNSSKPYLYFYSNNQFQFKKGYTFFVSGWVMTKRQLGVFERNSVFSIDTGFTKTFNKKINVAFSFNDIFRSLNSEEIFTVNNIKSKGIFYEDVREVSIALKYSFGSVKDSKFKSKDVNENSNRIN